MARLRESSPLSANLFYFKNSISLSSVVWRRQLDNYVFNFTFDCLRFSADVGSVEKIKKTVE